jgi:hypothetical protein
VERLIQYATVYFVSREYGGPEEGGWYYDQRVKHASFYVGGMGEVAADALVASLEAWTEFINEDVPPLHSVASEGRYLLVLEEREGEAERLHAPRWE